jgi:nucleoside-diphosphate-sugar epimerase
MTPVWAVAAAAVVVYRSAGRRAHTGAALVRAAARFVPRLEGLAALLGEPKPVSTAKATNVLGWQPRPTADTVADTGESLLRLHSR